MAAKKIGILALQGDVEKHVLMVEKAGALPIPVKTMAQFDEVDGLIIPGGESTTIGKLLVRFSLLNKLKTKISGRLPIFGTCAGAILLAKEILKSNQIKLGTMSVEISRNAYGPQVESFETDIRLSFDKKDSKPFRAVFIRAPIITHVSKKCEIFAEYEDHPVLVREKKMLIATFHPELTDDIRIHKYFIGMIE